jgi:Tfp pilus assembly protein PilE
MRNYGPRASFRAPLRTRVAAWLRDEAGDTMIEVMVAAILVALIAVATFTGYASVAHVASGQSTRAQAAALADADQARLHGLTLNNLSSSGASKSYGNTSYSVPVDGTTYTVSSSTQYVSGSGAVSCTTTGTSTADEVQTTSIVSWSSDAYAGGPVELHGLVTPPQGGSLIVRVLDSNGNGISGVNVTVSGPTSVSPLTTDSAGCVEFGGLTGGSYSASATQNGTNITGSSTVVATQTKTIVLTPAGGTGGISATFTTAYNGSTYPSSADQVTAYDPAATQQYTVFGSPSTLASNTYQSTVSSGGVLTPGNYTAYAGSCSGDYGSGGYQVAAVSSGTTQSVSLPLPAMLIDVWGSNVPTEYDDAYSGVTYSGSFTHASSGYSYDYDGTESWSSTAGNYVSFTFTGTSIQWITTQTSNHGFANIYIDGSLVATNDDTYAANTVPGYVGFVATGLSAGSHTIKILVDGTKDASSSGTFVTTDAFIVGTGDTSGQLDDPASASVSYSSGWTHSATGNQNYDSTESLSQTTGSYVQVTFTGTSIEWLAPVGTNDGYADIYLDGSLVESAVTAYNTSTTYKQVIWSDAGLSNGTHTLKIVVDGNRPSGSSANYVPIDSFIYGTQATGLLSTAPVVTLTDNNTGCSSQENYPATQTPTLTQGALVDPGQPYGNWTVCASSGGVKNTATVANTNYTTGNVVNVYLGTGASGLQSGGCT